MPQGRRKIAFSGKAKKQQMQAKKQRQNHLLNGILAFQNILLIIIFCQCSVKNIIKNVRENFNCIYQSCFPAARNIDDEDQSSLIDDIEYKRGIQKINKQPQDCRNKYALQFFKESQAELRKRKEEARNTIHMIPFAQQEVSDNYFPPDMDIPKRPSWAYAMSKDQLEIREQKYFNVSSRCTW